MPIGAQDKLEDLYALSRLLRHESAHLEGVREAEGTVGEGALRRYILEIQIAALSEEFSRINSRISDLLERDLER
jgi:hypothetical protein